MTGSNVAQVQHLFNESGINLIGKKRHEIKNIARSHGARTSAQKGAVAPVTSYATGDKYRNVWLLLCNHAKIPCQRFDIELLIGDDIRDFLQEHVIEAGLSRRTFYTYASALGKLETALTMYAPRFETGRSYSFRQAIEYLRPIARMELRMFHDTREYADPIALIKCINENSFRVAASVQNEGGARIREAALIKDKQLLDTFYDRISQTTMGSIQLDGTATKGGRARVIRVSEATYLNLSNIIANEGKFRVDQDAYRRQLRRAAEASGQDYNGSHGLRYNFAQRRYRQYLASGLGEIEAKLRIAGEMGHSRPGITEWYLGKQTK